MSFYNDILKNLRKGRVDYVFSEKQFEKLKSLCTEWEELILLKKDEDNYWYLALDIKEDYLL